MCVNVVRAVLRVILHDENSRLVPRAALRNRFDDAPECQIIVGGTRFRRWASLGGATGVIVWQADDHQVRKIAALFVVAQLPDHKVGPILIGYDHFPAHIICRLVGPN